MIYTRELRYAVVCDVCGAEYARTRLSKDDTPEHAWECSGYVRDLDVGLDLCRACQIRPDDPYDRRTAMLTAKDRAKRYIVYRRAFYEVFGEPLDRYWPSHSIGLDLQKFDQRHTVRDTQETRISYLRRTRGDRAAEIIIGLTGDNGGPTPAEIEKAEAETDQEPLT